METDVGGFGSMVFFLRKAHRLTS